MQINKHVHTIRIPFPAAYPSGVVVKKTTAVSFIYGTNGICLIDTGVASSAEMIFDYIRQTDRRIEDISLIIQTHSHPEHMGATRIIKAETRCEVAVHALEKEWIEDVQLQYLQRPVTGFDTLVAGPVAVDRILEDGEVFDLGCGLKLQIFHTPGHSPGSVSILLLGYGVLFSGDALPLPWEAPDYEDVMASVASMEKLKAVKDIQCLVASGDEPCRGGEVYKRMAAGLSYIQRVHETVLKVSGRGSPPDPAELCRRVWGEMGIPPETADESGASTIRAHLKVRGRKNILRQANKERDITFPPGS